MTAVTAQPEEGSTVMTAQASAVHHTSNNIATLIEGHAEDRIALIDGDRRVSYGELRSTVASMRHGLASHGVGPDDHIVLIGGNEIDFVVSALALLGLGAVVAPVRTNNPIPELKRKLIAVKPKMIVLSEGGSWIEEHASVIGYPMESVANIVQRDQTESAPIVPRSSDDLAFLMLTSGVSSDSKVAMLSHGNLAWMQERIIEEPEVGLAPADIVLGALPMTHIFGLNVVLLSTLRIGGTVVLQRRFDVDESMRLVKRHGVTTLTGAPPMWQRWAQSSELTADSFATVRHAASGAAALPIETFTAIRERYGVEIAEGYGLTETSPIVTWSRGTDVRPASVGKVMDGVEVVLVEPDGTAVETGDSGEIVVRSPGVFKGYLNAPELTANVLTEDGWFWTGDVGVFDPEGYLYIIDRIKDIIIVSGFNVYPGEVETVLMEHPDVRGAVVVGSPHGDTGETVVAHVAGAVDPDELDAFARERLSRYKCPTEYRFVDELPVSPNGKLIRRALR